MINLRRPVEIGAPFFNFKQTIFGGFQTSFAFLAGTVKLPAGKKNQPASGSVIRFDGKRRVRHDRAVKMAVPLKIFQPETEKNSALAKLAQVL